jgi:stage V sporulation protein R
VYAHADFFKNNFWFSKTNTKMMDEMANHATRVRRHIDRQGQEVVERFIDACLTIEHLIDPHSMFMQRAGGGDGRGAWGVAGMAEAVEEEKFTPERLPAKDYLDPFINPAREMVRQREEYEKKKKAQKGRVPERPTRDVLLFLMRHGRLDEWQQDILSIIRDEAYYYAPQAMTKVMNEGWATYWHSKLMTQHFLEAREIIDYAEQHSGVVHMPPGGFNPYKIGVELWKDIERRWNSGQHGQEWERLEAVGAREAFDDKSGKGRARIFEIRRIYNDVSFIDEFLTPEFVERHKMYQFRRDPQTGQLKIVSRDFDRIKQSLLYQLTNMGQPFVYVADGNYLNRGELYLAHQWNGLEVDVAKAREVLSTLRLIWGRPVHLQMRLDDDQVLLSIDALPGADGTGGSFRKQKINDETPEPAHLVQ